MTEAEEAVINGAVDWYLAQTSREERQADENLEAAVAGYLDEIEKREAEDSG